MLLARKLWQLVRDFRDHVPGSRLTTRTVAIFGALVVVPLLVVYLFSLEFLNRGIDSWFRVEIRQGLNDALVLSRSALDLRMREQARRTEASAAVAARSMSRRSAGCARSTASAALHGALRADRLRSEWRGRWRPAVDAREPLIVRRLPRELLMQVRGNRPYMSLEPLSERRLPHHHRRADSRRGRRSRGAAFLLARYECRANWPRSPTPCSTPTRNYGNLAELREPLKYQLPPGADAGAAAGHAVGDLWRDLFGAAAHAGRCRT